SAPPRRALGTRRSAPDEVVKRLVDVVVRLGIRLTRRQGPPRLVGPAPDPLPRRLDQRPEALLFLSRRQPSDAHLVHRHGRMLERPTDIRHPHRLRKDDRVKVTWTYDRGDQRANHEVELDDPNALEALLREIQKTGEPVVVTIFDELNEDSDDLPPGIQIGLGHPTYAFALHVADDGGYVNDPMVETPTEGLQ